MLRVLNAIVFLYPANKQYPDKMFSLFLAEKVQTQFRTEQDSEVKCIPINIIVENMLLNWISHTYTRAEMYCMLITHHSIHLHSSGTLNHGRCSLSLYLTMGGVNSQRSQGSQ